MFICSKFHGQQKKKKQMTKSDTGVRNAKMESLRKSDKGYVLVGEFSQISSESGVSRQVYPQELNLRKSKQPMV